MSRWNTWRDARSAVARVVLGLWIATAFWGCGSTSQVSPATRGGTPTDDLVVLVPGITATAMAERDTGRIAWGKGSRVFSPRDGGYALALPIGTGPDDPTSLEPAHVLEDLRIGPLRKPIYGPLLDALDASGWKRGRDLLAFPYDWRRDNLETVPRLAGWLAARAAERGHDASDPLPVSLVCQSNGSHLCRWLAKYGAISLEEAEALETAGRAPPGPPPEVVIERLVLIGTANGGALRNLREMDRGRNYVPLGLGRKWQPEVVFTFPSAFQDLAGYREDGRWFVSPSGEPLDTPLYDPRSWVEHGWSVFSPEVRERIEARGESGPGKIFGTEAERLAHLTRQLDRARRFRRQLRRDPPGYVAPAIHSVQNGYAATADRAVLVPTGDPDDPYELWFTEDPELHRRKELEALVSTPGDGHATLDSQLDLSPAEHAALRPPLYVTGTHFTLLHHPATNPAVIDALMEPGGP